MFTSRTLPALCILILLLLVHPCFAIIRYVNINNSSPGAGTSWATAYNDLNAALAAASSIDEIWVAQGTYKPTTSTDRTATFKVMSYYSIYGGFAGTETLRTQRDPKTNITILSGDIGVPGDASDNSYHVVTIGVNSKMLDGFTIRDGNADAGYPGSTTPQPNNSGGGVLVQGGAGVNSYGILAKCVITSNFAVYGGGFCSYANGASGQSMYEIYTTQFDNNTAVMGGAIALVIMNSSYGNGSIQNCIFTNNNCLTAQGSVMASMYDNGSGGSLLSSMHNSTLYNNTAPVIYNQQAGSFSSIITGQNDIVWKSGAPYAAGSLTAGPNISLYNCDLMLVTPPSGNFYDDPQFVNAAGNDLHTNCSSPVVDAGVNLSLIVTDFDGNPRPQGNGKDIGAYETGRPLSPAVANVTFCQNVTASVLTATPAAGNTLLWYTTASGGTGSATAPTPTTTSVGTQNYYVTQVNLSGCEGPRANIKAIISAGAATPTASNATYCLNDITIALTATGSNLLWYTAATGGTGSSTAPVPSTAAAGTTTWYVTQTPAGSCESARQPVAVTINSQPVAPATVPVNYCQGATAVPLTATGSSLLWYTTITGGSGTTTAPTPNTVSAGTTTWYVTQTPAGSCESSRTPVIVTVSNASAAPFAASPTYCQNTTATALTASGSNLLWYTAATGGIGNSTAPVPSTASAGTTTWYVTQTRAGSCESSRTPVVVTVNQLPQVSISTITNPLCAGNSVTLTATGASDYLWTPSTGLSDPTTNNPSALLKSDIVYAVVGKDNNGCADTTEISITIDAACMGNYTGGNAGFNIPNAFTPNGDGHNDLFRVKTTSIPKAFHLVIFNRYGGKVFESRDIQMGWNGTAGSKQAPEGAYVYLIIIETSAGKMIEKKGTLLLIR